jgi:hypothetical protein
MSAHKHIFSYSEALAIFPQVRTVTEVAVRQVEALMNRLQSREALEQQRSQIEAAQQQIIDTWQRAIAILGCETKGLWLVDWDTGDGYYCWCYPEPNLGFFHTYEEGFSGRVPVH